MTTCQSSWKLLSILFYQVTEYPGLKIIPNSNLYTLHTVEAELFVEDLIFLFSLAVLINKVISMTNI